MGPYALVTGTVVAANWSALVGVDANNPQTFLNHSIYADEFGADHGFEAWTFTSPTGASWPSSANCSDWTSTLGSGAIGASNMTTSLWTYSASKVCSVPSSLYCIEQ
jgi:hypothetical protein